MSSAGADLSVIVIAPVGRDAPLIRDALVGSGIEATICTGIADVIPRIRTNNLGALLLAEEVLDPASISVLQEQLASQPTWSDLPLLILTIGGSATVLSRRREQDRVPLGSVTLLERPIRGATLISSVQSALRSRSRQYEVRDTLLERDRAIQAQRESESKLRTAIEMAQLGSWEYDIEAGHFDVSETFRRALDLEAGKDLVCADVLSRVHPEDRAALEEKFWKAWRDNTPYSAEYRVIWRDGTVRHMSVRGRRVEDASDASGPGCARAGTRFAGVTLDITERVLSEMALRRADKLALVGRLSSSIAHEINNPLESVTNLLFILSNSPLRPTEREYVRLAQTELARVSEIAAQTLRFNRQQDASHEVVVTEILDSVLALYQGRLAMSQIEVERRYTYQQPCSCYPGEIRQIFTNLVGNAFDATRRGGRILVRERAATHPVTGRKGVRITVADTGSGMPPEVRSRVFEAFHSTKGNNGTGLGLWISRGIAENHGGTLRFSSSTSPAHPGSVFSLFLPLASGSLASEAIEFGNVQGTRPVSR